MTHKKTVNYGRGPLTHGGGDRGFDEWKWERSLAGWRDIDRWLWERTFGIETVSNTFILSQSNNNHNLNNKTTKTVVGLRLSNRWEPPPPPTTNSKLHDRAEIEQNSEYKSYLSIWRDPKTVFEPYPDPKNCPLGPQKVKMTPKLSQNQKWELKEL